MTNKLGSANPNRIPKPKRTEVKKADKEKIKYYQKLARYVYLREMQDKSFEEDNDLVPMDRSRFRISDNPNATFEESEPLPDDMPTPLSYVPRTPMKQGERVVMGKEMSKIGKELLEMVGSESHIDTIALRKIRTEDLPPKHIRQINGYRRFVWNNIEFELNQEQADVLEWIYKDFVETGNPYFYGMKYIDTATYRDIGKFFRGSEIIGNILVKVKQGEYEINLDF